MLRPPAVLLGCVVALTTWLVPAASSSPVTAVVAPAAPAAVVHDVVVSGDGVATYPAFSSDVERYAVTTDESTQGALTVTAQTSDPDGVVAVDGRPAPGGVRTVTGLSPGDEVTVFVDDAAGRAVHSFVYLPVDFPELRRVALPEAADDPSPGHVLLTLGLWTSRPRSSRRRWTRTGCLPSSTPPPTAWTSPVSRTGATASRGARARPRGAEIVELDDQLREIGRYRTVGLTHTDGHDAILLEDGSRYLLAYEPDPATGKTDAVVQHVAGDGTLLFEWNSADHVDIPAETVVGDRPTTPTSTRSR